MGREILTALRAALLTFVVTGLVYPFAVTSLAAILFSDKAGGSLVLDDKNQPIGSELLASDRTDTNSLWLTEQLNRMGIDVKLKTVVGDDDARLEEVVKSEDLSHYIL